MNILDDAVLIALVTAKIYANVKELRKKNSNPEVFGEKGLIQLTHKDRLLAFSFLFNIADIDPNKFYKPEDLGEIVLQQIRSHKDNDYPTIDSHTSHDKINAKDMNRTLEELEKTINLKSVEKRDQKNLKEVSNKIYWKTIIVSIPQ